MTDDSSPGPLVLVVDDDEEIRSALDVGLRYAGYRVKTEEDGLAAIRAVADHRPDLVVLDVGMPGVDGVQVTRRLREDGDLVPICILSARSEVDDRVAGLQAGADDYVVKPFETRELTARIEALLRRRGDEPMTEVLRCDDLRIEPDGHRVRRGERELELTNREFQLLLALAREKEVVLSRARLLELVWGYDAEVETNVLDVFVGYLRRKLEAEGEPRLIHTVRGVGFVLRPA